MLSKLLLKASKQSFQKNDHPRNSTQTVSRRPAQDSGQEVSQDKLCAIHLGRH
jgi:hypothetical protein